MSIRVSQQFIQYLADPNTESDLRVSKVFAQVAVSQGSSETVQAIANTIFGDADDNSVEQSGTFRYVSTTNAFFTDAADNEADVDPVFNIFVSQSMFSEATETNYYEASNEIFSEDANNLVGWNQQRFIVQYLGFTDRHLYNVGNTLGLTGNDHAAEASDIVVSNHFFTSSNDNIVVQAHRGENTFSLSDSIVANNYAFVEQFLTMTGAVTSTGPSGRSPSQTGFLNQSVGFTISDNTCREKEYAPLIGEGAEGFEELQASKPVLSSGTLTLSYPFISPTTTLVLENPEFGNTDEITFTRIDRDTRGGDRKIFADAKWAEWERLNFTIKDLCEVDADTIAAFLTASLGKKIGLVDWEGRIWEGIIVEPETDIVKEQGGHGLTLTFEGRITEKFVQHGGLNVIHGQDDDGEDIQVVHND